MPDAPYVVPTEWSRRPDGRVQLVGEDTYGRCEFLAGLAAAAREAPAPLGYAARFQEWLRASVLPRAPARQPRPVFMTITDSDGHSHASHRGLSADIAYFATDLEGAPVELSSEEAALAEFRWSREAAASRDPAARDASAAPGPGDVYARQPGGRVLRLDLPRTAAFLKQLLVNPHIRPTTVFVSRHIRGELTRWLADEDNARMLDEAAPPLEGASAALRRLIAAAPYADERDARLHNDHFHVDAAVVRQAPECVALQRTVSARR